MKIANVNKSLDFLRKIEKVKTRNLHFADEIVKGSKKVIWGLLYDMWLYYKNKNLGISSSPVPHPKPVISELSSAVKKPKFIIKIKKEEYSNDDNEINSKYSENIFKINKNGVSNNYADVSHYKTALSNRSSNSDLSLNNQ